MGLTNSDSSVQSGVLVKTGVQSDCLTWHPHDDHATDLVCVARAGDELECPLLGHLSGFIPHQASGLHLPHRLPQRPRLQTGGPRHQRTTMQLLAQTPMHLHVEC